MAGGGKQKGKGKGRGKGAAARRDAQLQRLAATQGAAGQARRSQERGAAARAAAVTPSAARWLVRTDPQAPAPAAPAAAAPGPVAAAVDVVADLLALDPRTNLRGRGGDVLRRLAGQVADLIAADATLPSGRHLTELVTADPDLAVALRPSLDLDALLTGAPIPGDRHDRTVRTAEALLERARAHRAGEVDLHALAAPVGSARHDHADEVETIVRVALDGLAVPPSPDPAVTVTSGGWLGAGPVELFLAAGRGALAGRAADVAGAALVAWLSGTELTADAGWLALQRTVPVDASALVQAAAARAGSDHPDVAGAALVELIALRHPIAPPT